LLDAIRDRVAILADVDPSAVRADTPFADFGVDSLMLLELVAMVEQHLGFEVPERDFGSLGTLSDIDRYVTSLARTG
jgi:acyl carrier protein